MADGQTPGEDVLGHPHSPQGPCHLRCEIGDLGVALGVNGHEAVAAELTEGFPHRRAAGLKHTGQLVFGDLLAGLENVVHDEVLDAPADLLAFGQMRRVFRPLQNGRTGNRRREFLSGFHVFTPFRRKAKRKLYTIFSNMIVAQLK